MRDNKKFTTKFIRERLPFVLLDEVREWMEKRNALIHDLANTPYDSEKVREVAEEGGRERAYGSRKVNGTDGMEIEPAAIRRYYTQA